MVWSVQTDSTVALRSCQLEMLMKVTTRAGDALATSLLLLRLPNRNGPVPRNQRPDHLALQPKVTQSPGRHGHGAQ